MIGVSGYDTSSSTALAKAVFVKNALRRLKVTRPNGQTSARVPGSYLQRESRGRFKDENSNTVDLRITLNLELFLFGFL